MDNTIVFGAFAVIALVLAIRAYAPLLGSRSRTPGGSTEG
jgi:hypothetical protein